ncbi:MAG: hypothetical protein ACC742_07035 [Thermoanaerobaculales bacterium]
MQPNRTNETRSSTRFRTPWVAILTAIMAVAAGCTARAAVAQTTGAEQTIIGQLEEEFTGDLPEVRQNV